MTLTRIRAYRRDQRRKLNILTRQIFYFRPRSRTLLHAPRRHNQTLTDGVHRQHARNTPPAGRALPRSSASTPPAKVMVHWWQPATQHVEIGDHVNIGNRQRADCSIRCGCCRARRGDDTLTTASSPRRYQPRIKPRRQRGAPARRSRAKGKPRRKIMLLLLLLYVII